jgi:hypothetical protein
MVEGLFKDNAWKAQGISARYKVQGTSVDSDVSFGQAFGKPLFKTSFLLRDQYPAEKSIGIIACTLCLVPCFLFLVPCTLFLVPCALHFLFLLL